MEVCAGRMYRPRSSHMKERPRFRGLKSPCVRESLLFVQVPVGWCGEHPQDDVPAVHPDDGAGGVEQVKVEVGIAGHGAVQTGL